MPEKLTPKESPTKSASLSMVRGRLSAAFRVRSWGRRNDCGVEAIVLLGQPLPNQVGKCFVGMNTVFCLAPENWLIVSQEQTPNSLRQALEPDLAAQGLALVDQTDGLSVIEIQGRCTRDLIAKGCGLDLRESHFPPGRCAQTRFAQIALTLHCMDETPSFALFVGQSYQSYLWNWLEDAQKEFFPTPACDSR